MDLEELDDVVIVAFEELEKSKSQQVYRLKEEEKGGKKSGQSSVQTSQGDRWASLDDDDEDTLQFTDKIGLTSEQFSQSLKVEKEAINLTLEPGISEFASTLQKFMQHCQVYGTGWLTGLQIKTRGRLQGTGDKARGQVSVTLLDIGLVPGNYIQKCSFS